MSTSKFLIKIEKSGSDIDKVLSGSYFSTSEELRNILKNSHVNDCFYSLEFNKNSTIMIKDVNATSDFIVSIFESFMEDKSERAFSDAKKVQ